MKQLFLGLCALSIFAMTSCEKEENTNQTKPEMLLGKWQLSTMYNMEDEDITTYCDKETQKEFRADHSLVWFESRLDGSESCTEIDYNAMGECTYSFTDDGKLNLHWVSFDGSATHNFDNLIYEVKDNTLILKISPEHKGIYYTKK